MPASFLARHRTICAVLEEMRELSINGGDPRMVRLIDEAKRYAEAMSNRLMRYKAERSNQPK